MNPKEKEILNQILSLPFLKEFQAIAQSDQRFFGSIANKVNGTQSICNLKHIHQERR